MRKKTLTIVAGAALALALGVSAPAHSASAANAEGDRLWSPQEEQRLRDFWNSNEVPGDVQERLISDGRRGIEPDSMSVEAAAVKSVTTQEDYEVVTTSTFADGSVAVASLELPRPAPKGANVERCTVTGGSGFRTFTNCKVAGQSGLVGMGFYVTYTLVQGGNDYISSTWGGTKMCSIGAKCVQPFRDREKKKQDAAGYAGSSWGMSADVLGFGGTYYLTLSVGGDKATAKFG